MLSRRSLLLAAASSAFVSACSHGGGPEEAAPAEAAAAPRPEPLIKPWGYPLEALDRTAKPGDDFFRFANGGWLDATPIPADRTGTGFSVEMSDRNDARFAELVAELQAAPQAPGSEGQKIRDLHRSMLDVQTIEAKGLGPAQAGLARIEAAKSHDDIAVLMASAELGLPGPFGAGVTIDPANPDIYTVAISHGGLSLPNRDYYLSDNARLKTARDAFRAHLESYLGLCGQPEPGAKADAILALETAIAERHWANERRRQADQTNNPTAAADLPKFAPGFAWGQHLAEAGFADIPVLILREKDAFPGLASLFAATPVATWKAYLTYHYLRAHAPYLPAAYDAAAFDFYGRTLAGQQEQRPRDKRAIDLVNGSLDQALGRVYVERYLPAEAKPAMTAIFENIRFALGERIKGLSWMSPETKARALEKLAAMNAKIAYPEVWRDFSGLQINPDDLFGNIVRLRMFEDAESRARLTQAVDKREWFTGPQTINAFYSPNRNEAFIPAGYMQPPLFDAFADPAVNYGAIGSIIGHEIGHGFDDQGSKYDARGELKSWWTTEDRARFEAAAGALAAQYSQFEPLPGLPINGKLTLGENLGDLVGMLVTVEAYKRSLNGAEPPVLDGFTGLQRVFLGRAQARRFKQTEEALRRQLVQGPHSPHAYRVNGLFRNVDAWYEAFDVQPGEALYVAPEARVRIW